VAGERDVHLLEMRTRSSPVAAQPGVARGSVVIAPGGVVLCGKRRRDEHGREDSTRVAHGVSNTVTRPRSRNPSPR
jgi:hypothetical protein